jgi:hypothetical protein
MSGKNNSTYISSATTTQVKTGGGVLHRIILGETAAGAITIYDETGSGTDKVIGVLKASVAEQEFDFGCVFGEGLKIVTAAASKLTVIYE